MAEVVVEEEKPERRPAPKAQARVQEQLLTRSGRTLVQKKNKNAEGEKEPQSSLVDLAFKHPGQKVCCEEPLQVLDEQLLWHTHKNRPRPLTLHVSRKEDGLFVPEIQLRRKDATVLEETKQDVADKVFVAKSPNGLRRFAPRAMIQDEPDVPEQRVSAGGRTVQLKPFEQSQNQAELGVEQQALHFELRKSPAAPQSFGYEMFAGVCMEQLSFKRRTVE